MTTMRRHMAGVTLVALLCVGGFAAAAAVIWEAVDAGILPMSVGIILVGAAGLGTVEVYRRYLDRSLARRRSLFATVPDRVGR